MMTSVVLKKQNDRGFTLIELLVVISIIALLSSVILAALSGARSKAYLASGQQFELNTYNAFYNDIIGDWRFEKNVCTGGNVYSIPDNGPLGIITLYSTGSIPCASKSDTPVSNSGTLNLGNTGSIYFYPSPGNNPAIQNNSNLKSLNQTKIGISFWLKIPDTVNRQIFVISSDNGTTEYNQIFVSNNIMSITSKYLTSGCYIPIPSDMNWHQYLINFNGPNNLLTLYIDGKAQSTTCALTAGFKWTIGDGGWQFMYSPAANFPPFELNHLILYANAI